MTTTLNETLLDVVRAEGPLDFLSLKSALSRRGHVLGDGEYIRLLTSEAAALCGTVGPDENLFVAMDLLLAGRTFTHRLTAFDIAHDCVPVWPDFGHLYPLLGTSPFDRIDDYLLRRAVHPDRAFSDLALLRPGSFAGTAPGDLIGVRLGSGRQELVEVRRVGSLSAQAEIDIADLFEPGADDFLGLDDPDDPGEPTQAVLPREIGHVVRHLCHRHPTIFRAPLPPLGELFAQLQLEVRDDAVGPSGLTDWYGIGGCR